MPDSEQDELRQRILNLQNSLAENFVAKHHIARLVVLAAISGEPMLMVGAPGSGKSAIVKRFARLVDVSASTFLDYVITPETSATEFWTPPSTDAPSGQSGAAALMNAQIVFLDEVFHASSSILNPLLRRLSPWETEAGIADSAGQGRFSLVVAAARSLDAPVPNPSLLDRFTLQVHCDTVNQANFSEVIRAGTRSDMAARRPIDLYDDGRCTVFDMVAAQNCIAARLDALTSDDNPPNPSGEKPGPIPTESNATLQKGQPGNEGEPDGDAIDFRDAKGFKDFEAIIRRLEREDRVFISDRKLIRLYKLLVTDAWLHNEPELTPRTLGLLAYIGNTRDEMQILADKVPLLIDHLS